MEEWRAVVGFEESYSISSTGRVRSEDRYVRHNKGGFARKRGKILSQYFNKDGYASVVLAWESKTKTVITHHLVLAAFVGPRPSPAHHGCHNNGVRDDNRLENLRWDTIEGNFSDKWLHGTMPIGERGGTAKITDAQAAEIRASAERPRFLAQRYGITSSHVWAIRSGKVRRYA